MDRTALINALRKLISDLIQCVDGNIDENFWSAETIGENLIISDSGASPDSTVGASLEEEYEYNLFNNLFDNSGLRDCYHYTSFENLFHIINTGKLHLNSLIGLNDKSEINRVNNFMGRAPANPYHPVTIWSHNNHFIFCLSQNRDQLNQWRLYGDDASGVMIKFYIDSDHFPHRNILLSKVTYDLNVFDILKKWQQSVQSSLNTQFGFYSVNYWKFFFKNEDYKDENEVRLLIRNTDKDGHLFEERFKLNRYGIIVPYIEIDCIGEDASFVKIEKITLGPKFREPEINSAQLNYVIERKYPHERIEILKSTITHYR